MLSILTRKRASSTLEDTTARASHDSDDATLTEFSRMAHEMGVGGAYERKAALINRAIKQEIGFGRFQIWLTFLAGFGWFVDNIWFQALSMSLPQIKLEFEPTHVQFATLALYTGLLIGATFWGFMSDVIGRRPSWNITLFISAVFGIAVGGAPNFVAFGALLSCLGLGVGRQFARGWCHVDRVYAFDASVDPDVLVRVLVFGATFRGVHRLGFHNQL